MAKWVAAEVAPKSWESDFVWRYKPWDKQVDVYYLPADYSREPHHCYGLMFQKYLVPKPPAQ